MGEATAPVCNTDFESPRRLGRTRTEVTPLGSGTAALGNLYAPVADDTAVETVAAALAGGVRYFDTAPYYGYGLAEERLGAGLVAAASDVVVSSKVGRLLVPRSGPARSDQGYIDAGAFDPVFDYSYDAVMRSVESSRARLSRDRIDVLLFHDLGRLTHGDEHEARFAEAMEGGYRALEELRRNGDVGAIGLGVNECEILLEAAERGDFDCFLLAGRYTLLEQSPLDQLLPMCERRDISLIIGGPFNSGVLASDLAAGSPYDYQAAGEPILDRARALRNVCDRHGVALAHAALRFPLHHPAVAAVIPGARSSKEVRANLAALHTEVPPELWQELKSLGLLDPRAPVPSPGS